MTCRRCVWLAWTTALIRVVSLNCGVSRLEQFHVHHLPTYLPTYLPACMHAHSNSLHVAALTLDQILILLHLHCLFFVYKQANTQTNTHTHTDKVVVGSFQGMLRVYSPASESFSPHHLSLEKKTCPILQVAVGRFDLLRAYVRSTDTTSIACLAFSLLHSNTR